MVRNDHDGIVITNYNEEELQSAMIVFSGVYYGLFPSVDNNDRYGLKFTIFYIFLTLSVSIGRRILKCRRLNDDTPDEILQRILRII